MPKGPLMPKGVIHLWVKQGKTDHMATLDDPGIVSILETKRKESLSSSSSSSPFDMSGLSVSDLTGSASSGVAIRWSSTNLKEVVEASTVRIRDLEREGRGSERGGRPSRRRGRQTTPDVPPKAAKTSKKAAKTLSTSKTSLSSKPAAKAKANPEKEVPQATNKTKTKKLFNRKRKRNSEGASSPAEAAVNDSKKSAPAKEPLATTKTTTKPTVDAAEGDTTKSSDKTAKALAPNCTPPQRTPETPTESKQPQNHKDPKPPLEKNSSSDEKSPDQPTDRPREFATAAPAANRDSPASTPTAAQDKEKASVSESKDPKSSGDETSCCNSNKNQIPPAPPQKRQSLVDYCDEDFDSSDDEAIVYRMKLEQERATAINTEQSESSHEGSHDTAGRTPQKASPSEATAVVATEDPTKDNRRKTAGGEIQAATDADAKDVAVGPPGKGYGANQQLLRKRVSPENNATIGGDDEDDPPQKRQRVQQKPKQDEGIPASNEDKDHEEENPGSPGNNSDAASEPSTTTKTGACESLADQKKESGSGTTDFDNDTDHDAGSPSMEASNITNKQYLDENNVEEDSTDEQSPVEAEPTNLTNWMKMKRFFSASNYV
mmetsp:Transcript_22519/g.47667  ORF Transcript_22519/g.47667 Transcript_22519/m.47667 type:complete len:604 (-) Transcript_22519:1903-3714(-)